MKLKDIISTKPSENKVFVARTAVFLERGLLSKKK